MLPPTHQILAALAALRPDWKPADIRVEEYQSGGYSHLNYRLRHRSDRYVLRLMESVTPAAFRREVALLQALRDLFPRTSSSLRLDIASVAAASLSTNPPRQGWMLTRWSDLPLLAETSGVGSTELATFLAGLHKGLAALGSHPPAELRTVIHSEDANVSSVDRQITADLRRCRPVPGSDPNLARRLLAQLPPAGSPGMPAHLDLNPWNLLTDRSSWLTLDWETFGSAEPLFDLVALCEGYLRSQSREQEQAAFTASALRTYNQLSNSRLTDAALSTARTRFHWREYAWAAGQVAQGNHREEIVTQYRDYGGLLREQGFEIFPGSALTHWTQTPNHPE